jgi:histidinol-phosphate aminotransferase
MKTAAAHIHRYPEQFALLQALAVHLGAEPDSLIIGNGSNNVLDLIARTYLGKGDEAVVSEYAFAMYRLAVQSAGATTVVAAAKDYGHDLEAMRSAITPSTKIIWLANPNNPTGTFIPYARIKQFLRRVPQEVIVVLDEAYREYVPAGKRANPVEWVQAHPNLIVVRTFSKIYGLAGLRIGYGIAAADVAELLNRVRLPFNAGNPAIAAATAALEDQAFVAKSYAANTLGRSELIKELQALGYVCLPAYGNFVTCKTGAIAQVGERLLGKGIIVRPLGGYRMPDWIRVTVGLPAENNRFLAALAVISAQSTSSREQ